MRYKFSEITINYDSKRVPLSAKQRESRKGQYPYYGAQGIIDYIDDYIFDGKYLLIAEDGENLRSKKQKVAQLAVGRYWVNNHAHIVQTNEKCLLEYLYYLFNVTDISGYITGSAQPKLSQANLNAIEFELPPVQEQAKVVSILSALDDKIELNQKINENLERQAQALFKEWFVDFSLFKSNQPTNWGLVTLGSLASLISRGITPKYADTSEQIVLNQKCIRNHLIDLSLARKHRPKAVNEKWLHFGDLLINSTGEGTLGRAAQVWFAPQNMTVDSHITIVRPKEESLIYYIGLWGLLHEREIESLHTGSTGQTELPRERVKSMLLLSPDNETLAEFNAAIAPMVATIVHNQNESLKLAKIRDTLIPELMSGEIEMLQS